ncbi:TonB-dependent receptor [Solitalea koreensis]|uniref:Iron complex outermembrane recepter protein n=1 Tax=Solitalea koreensis TaxID=543615 RepID=A0A521AV59_9SPHI|nr:TonB-dependent receptor [Solitalea koreensis]SMO38699.1 iron complex outermembrane recepter protein [Solitalea koreensis]
MKFKLYNNLIIGGCLLTTVLPLALKAQNNISDSLSHKLNEVVITENLNRQKAQSVVRLGAAEIKRGQGVFMEEAINTNVPGVMMMRRSVSGGQQFNIRGYGNGLGARGANNNFDSQGLKVYLNGIPVTDAEGITIMDDIDFGSVSNVDIVKGPAGSMYGLAIAGAVNLQTQKAEPGKVSIGQDVMLGEYGLRRYTTRLQTSGERSSLMVNYGRQHSDGFMPHNASDKNFVSVMGDYQPNEKQKLTAFFGYSNSYDERAGELTIDQYNKKDYTGNPNYIKNDAHSEVIGFRFGLGHTLAFNKNLANTTSVFASSNKNTASSAGGWTDKSPVNAGFRSSLDFKFNLLGQVNVNGTAGVEAQQQTYQNISYAMVPNNADLNGYNIIGAMRSNVAITNKNFNAFTELTFSLPKLFDLTAGLGLSTMDIRLQDRVYNASNNNASPELNKPTSYGNKYDNLLSPHVMLSRTITKGISAYASYSVGYRAPVSSNLFIAYTGKVNTDLKPEKGTQFEIGTKGSLINARLSYQVAVFNTDFADKMSSVSVANAGNTATLYSYIVNSGSQKNKGVEVLAKYAVYQSTTGFFQTIAPFANLTYSDFKYDNYRFQNSTTRVMSDYSGLAVAGAAPWIYNLGVDAVTNHGVYGNVNFNHRDAMPITSDGLNETKAFSLSNAKVGYQHTFLKQLGVDVFFGANNITGNQYYNMVFVNQMPDAFIPGPGKINYFGGINLKYTL